MPSALLALFIVANNHFWPLAISLRFPLLSKKLVFLGPSWVPSALLALFFVVAANHFRPLANSFRFTLLHKKLVLCLPGTFLCVCGRPPLSAPGQLISFPLAFQKIVFLGSPWVPSALLALFFIVTNHFWPLANSFRFTLLSKGLYFLASSGHYVVRTLLALFL